VSRPQILIREVERSLFLRELDFDRGHVSWLAFLTQHFGSDSNFGDIEFACEEPSATHLDDINSLRYHTASSLHGEFLTAAVELHHYCCYVTHQGFLPDEDCVGWNAASGGRSFLVFCLFGHALFTSVSKPRQTMGLIDPKISSFPSHYVHSQNPRIPPNCSDSELNRQPIAIIASRKLASGDRRDDF